MLLPVVALPLTLLAGVCAGASWLFCWALVGRFGWLGLRFNIGLGLRFRGGRIFDLGIDELE